MEDRKQKAEALAAEILNTITYSPDCIFIGGEGVEIMCTGPTLTEVYGAESIEELIFETIGLNLLIRKKRPKTDIKNIKTPDDIAEYIEGTLNDYTDGEAGKEETQWLIVEMCMHVIQLAQRAERKKIKYSELRINYNGVVGLLTRLSPEIQDPQQQLIIERAVNDWSTLTGQLFVKKGKNYDLEPVTEEKNEH